MHYEVEVGGRTRQVVVARAGDGFAVTVDGRTYHVDAARIDAHTLSLLVDTMWPGSYEVSIAPDPVGGSLVVRVGSTSLTVTLNGRRRFAGKEDGGVPGSGPQRITAPMPGKIVRVLVGGGDPVRARQPLIVIEAMKMENELRAARDGTVDEIHAREGMSVDGGALLLVIL